MKAGRVVMIVIGALMALVGFGLLAGSAGALVGYATHRDDDGFFRTPEVRLASPTYAIVSDRIDLSTSPGPSDWLMDRGTLGTVKLTLDPADPQTPVFAGIGPSRDVAAYLDGVNRDQIRDVDVSPNRVRYRRRAGEAIPAPPGQQPFWVEQITTDDGKKLSVTVRRTLPGYFEALGLAPLEGRLPQVSDLTSGRRVAVINQRAAKRLFPEGRAAGRVITHAKEPTEVIGVVPDLKNLGGNDGSMPSSMREPLELFATYQAAPTDRPEPMVVVVRPKANAAALPERLRQAALAVGPRAIVERVRLGTDWLDATVVTPRRRTVLLSLLGALGLLLTLIGVSGMTAYAVARRTQEIGVRMALGAKPGEILLSFSKRGLALTLAGLVIGLVLAAIAAWSMTSLLYGFRPDYAPTVSAVSLILLGVAALACFVPARRASRVDPVIALRNE
jgi:hypothetical protein